MELDTAREIGEVALSALIKELGSGAVISDNLDLLKEFDSVDLVSLIDHCVQRYASRPRCGGRCLRV